MILYQLGMLLLAYVAVSAVVTFIVVKVASWIAVSPKTKWLWCGLSVAFFVLLPIWDIPIAWWQFKHLCETEAGVNIIRSVDEVEGFSSEFFGSEDSLTNYGYKFVERKMIDGNWVRYSSDAHRKVVTQRIESPTARYRIERHEIPLRHVYKTEIIIDDTETKNVLATMTRLGYRGGWLAKRFHWSYTPEDSCGGHEMSIDAFFIRTLRPSGLPSAEKGEAHGND